MFIIKKCKYYKKLILVKKVMVFGLLLVDMYFIANAYVNGVKRI